MKKISVLCCSLMLAFSLTACGNSTQTQSESSESASETTANPEISSVASAATEAETSADTSADEEPENAEGKTLVVYYSATGSTEMVAGYIADAVGADLFELEPVNPYTSEDLDWTNENSRVSVEHENESERDVELVSATLDNWDEYDTVFVGYPIWWGIAAWPVDAFIETNDFTGKTVIPFCTSASSDLGESGELLAKMAGTGEWQTGMRFRSSASEDEVKVWMEDLGMTN
ncbi:MAG: flavodoxin [Ruminococcus sp.]|nr:flavodoxin [Ruminococcus sp.]